MRVRNNLGETWSPPSRLLEKLLLRNQVRGDVTVGSAGGDGGHKEW